MTKRTQLITLLIALLLGTGRYPVFSQESIKSQKPSEPALLPVGDQAPRNARASGYKGIWFTLGQFSEYGDKYSGGLGTYTADHIPIAIYAPEVNRTYFVYGGTTAADQRHLLIMLSWFDHKKRIVPKPVIVYDKMGVDDPHDNASLSIDRDGYLWVFISGRNVVRKGLIFKSTQPWSIDQFEQVHTDDMTYPQPWYLGEKGFFYLFTRYTKGRELYWSASADGKTWDPAQKLAGMGGHYQVSNRLGDKIITAFNYHPGGNVDKRTNLYFVQTEDLGKSWKTIDGQVVKTPLTDTHCPALIRDFEAEGKLVYINDINFDKSGNPVILAIVSRFHQPGPKGDPRTWMLISRKDGKWSFTEIGTSTHNYDMGSIYTDGETWKIIGPTGTGPQKWGTGGEMELWESRDEGGTWTKTTSITRNSALNHSYARRPLNAHKDFYAIWADGDADKISESRLFFTDAEGKHVWMLPYEMGSDFAKPLRIR